MSLDNLIRNTREGLPVSPQDAARHQKRIKAHKFFDMTQELKADGTLGGKKLSNKERIRGFKAARGGADSVDWKKFVNEVETRKEEASVGKSMKMLPGSSDMGGVLETISADVKTIIGIIDARTDAEKAAADELKQEDEKDKRKKKEEDKEKGAKGMKVPGFIKKAAEPITNIWAEIVKTFAILLAGWGIDKIFKWLRNPKNKKAVEELKEFITVAAPAIIKGILALVALDIGLKVARFAAMLAKGSLTLLGGLKNLTVTLVKWAFANPQIALAIGLGALLVGGGIAAHNQLKKNRQAFDEQDDDSTLTVDEFSEQEDKSKVDIKPSQAYSEVGTFPGMMNFNTGGTVPGSGNKDTVPAMLTPGEFVMSKGAVQKYGASTLANMNAAAGGTNKPTLMGGYNEGGQAIDKSHYGTTGYRIGQVMPDQFVYGHEKYTATYKTKGGEVVEDSDDYKEVIGAIGMPDLIEHQTQLVDSIRQVKGYEDINFMDVVQYPHGQGRLLDMPKEKLFTIFNASDAFKATGAKMDVAHKIDLESRGHGDGSKGYSMMYSGGGLVPIQNFKGGGGVKAVKTATQLINSVPGGSSSSGGGVSVVPIPSGGKSGVVPSGTTSSDEPLFSPLDPDNLSTLIMKSMYSILD